MVKNKLRTVILIIGLVGLLSLITNFNNQEECKFPTSREGLYASLAFSYDVNLSNSEASYVGEYAGDRAGWAVAGVGDVNGDSYDDFLIGARRYNASKGDEGKIYLILGRSNGFSTDLNLNQANASFIGEYEGDFAGWSVDGVGDVNNDTYDDFLISAPSYDVSDGDMVGKAYLIFGKETGWTKNMNLSNADASFIGEHANDNAGYSICGAGDVNGDDFKDLLIGAYLNDEGEGDNAGQVYLIFGKATGWTKNMNLSNADASFIGEHANDYAGSIIGGGGDINGDDYDDFLIGARRYNASKEREGKVYIFFGKSAGWVKNMEVGSANASFVGERKKDLVGDSISGECDVNGDNYDDILIGTHFNDDGAYLAGKTYVIFGNDSGWGNNVNISNADASYIGESASDQSGVCVASVGDVNGDIYDDFLIGSPGYDVNDVDDIGKTYLIFGKDIGWKSDVNLSDAGASFIGEHGGDNSGFSLNGAGDVNGDGYNDILIGAYTNDDGGGSNSGKAYLLLANPIKGENGKIVPTYFPPIIIPFSMISIVILLIICKKKIKKG